MSVSIRAGLWAGLWAGCLLAATACGDDETQGADSSGDDADAGEGGGEETGDLPGDLPGPPETIPATCPSFDMGQVAMFEQTGDTATGAGLRGAECGGRGAPEHTYAWTAPQAGFYELIVEADFDAVLYTIKGGCDEEVWACSDDVAAYGKQPHLFIDAAEAGERWTIVLDGHGTASPSYGPYTLRLRPFEYAPCPTEDLGSELPASRSFMSANGIVDLAPQCSGLAPEVVYSWTAPADGNYAFRTSSDQLVQSRLLITDTVCGDGEVLYCGQRGSVLAMKTGETVSLGLNQLGPFEGMVSFELYEYQCSPTGDLGSTLPASATGTIDPAQAELGSSCGGNGGESIYTWTAPADGDYRFSTAGSSGDTVIHIRDGAECAGTLLACDDDVSNQDLTSSALATLSSGQTVSVVVDTLFINDPVDYELSITEEN